MIIGFLKLGFLILTEVYQAKKRARENQEKYEITQARFIEISQKCIEKFKAELLKDGQASQNIEDKMDGGGR